MARTQIVLGIDDSPTSRSALRWAAGYARLTGCSLRAIHALPVVIDAPDEWSGTDHSGHRIIPPERVIESVRIRVTNTYEAIQPSLGWQLHFVEGDPGPVLVEESVHSRALVVGTREHTGLARIAIGSVSHYCLSHARCPVIAVPSAPLPIMEQPPATARMGTAETAS